MMEEATGELTERRLDHEGGEAQEFYRGLQGPVRVGIEATGQRRPCLRQAGPPLRLAGRPQSATPD